MGYVTGQITSSASHLDDLITAIEAEMTAHAAWTFIEEYDISSSVRYRIWRNEWDQNDWGESFYIAFMFDPNYGTSDSFYIKVFEDWDPVSKLAKRGCPRPSNTATPEPDGSGRGDTADDLGASSVDSYHWSGAYADTNNVDFTYWFSVNKNCIIGSTTLSPYAVYAGLFESFGALHVNEFPLVIIPLDDHDADYSGSCTRRPGEEGNYMSDAFAVEGLGGTWTTAVGTVPSGYALYGGSALGGRLKVENASSSAGPGLRGLLYHLLHFDVEAGVEEGDTITVNGDTWVLIHNGSYHWFMNTAAV